MKKNINRISLWILTILLPVAFLVSGCGTTKKKEKDEGPQPLYGPPNVSINQPQSGK